MDYNLMRYIEMPSNGHFAPLDEPEFFAKDAIDFLKKSLEKIEPAF